MAVNKYEVTPLFAEPLFRAKIGHAITKEQIAYIQNTKMNNNKMNQISDNLYLLEEPELKSIKNAVQEALDIYAIEVMGITQKLEVTQSWALINQANEGMHGHTHSNSLISGSIYYCDLPAPIAGMVFDRDTAYRQIELNPVKDKNNIYNTPMNVVDPKKNDLLLFSSHLQHFVQVNSANKPRHSIAFNTFVRGTIGSFKDVSELKL